MSSIVSLLEQLTALAAPSLLALQALVGAPFSEMDCGAAWQCEAAYPESGIVASVVRRQLAQAVETPGSAVSVTLTFRRQVDIELLLHHYPHALVLHPNPHSPNSLYIACLRGRGVMITANSRGAINSISVSNWADTSSMPNKGHTCDVR